MLKDSKKILSIFFKASHGATLKESHAGTTGPVAKRIWTTIRRSPWRSLNASLPGRSEAKSLELSKQKRKWIGKPWKNYGKTMEKPWTNMEKLWKMMEKLWKMMNIHWTWYNNPWESHGKSLQDYATNSQWFNLLSKLARARDATRSWGKELTWRSVHFPEVIRCGCITLSKWVIPQWCMEYLNVSTYKCLYKYIYVCVWHMGHKPAQVFFDGIQCFAFVFFSHPGPQLKLSVVLIVHNV